MCDYLSRDRFSKIKIDFSDLTGQLYIPINQVTEPDQIDFDFGWMDHALKGTRKLTWRIHQINEQINCSRRIVPNIAFE